MSRKDKKPEIIKKFIEKSLEPREVEMNSTKPNIEQSLLLSDMKSDISSSNNMKSRKKKEFNESWDRVEFYLKKQKALRDKRVSDKDKDSQTKETVIK